MRLLPPQTLPFPTRIERVHSPRPARGRYGFRQYRPCLRWEFGFTCAFCLLHEADLAEHGTERTGLGTVEHFVPVSTGTADVHRYSNCFYACRFCNVARGATPVAGSDGRRLINPCDDVWGDRFSLAAGDRLLPVDGDADAAYTAQVYDLNDPRKIVMRQSRRERLAEWLQLLEEGPALEAELLRQASSAASSTKALTNLQAARQLRRCIEAARRDIQRYAAIPVDADTSCRCTSPPELAPPPWLGEQSR